MVFALALSALLERPPAVRQAAPQGLPTGCGVAPADAAIKQPPELRSHNGILNVTLVEDGNRVPNLPQPMCYEFSMVQNGQTVKLTVPPTLRLKQGDHLVMTLVNNLLEPPGANRKGVGVIMDCGQPQLKPTPPPDPTTGRIYGYHRSPWNEVNMHFHGLNTSPKAPSDDVVNVLVCPRKSGSDTPGQYTYVVDIPRNEPPGLYWYHPHPHGESEHQVQNGLTGAIIVDPLAPGIPEQMPNRVIVVRDFLNAGGGIKNARLAQTPVTDIRDIRAQLAAGIKYANTGDESGPMPDPFGKPGACPPTLPTVDAKEITVNYVPVPLGSVLIFKQPEPHTVIPAGQTEFYRLANTASDTVLDLELKDGGKVLPLQVVTRDGVPLITKGGHPTWQAVPMRHVIVPPAGRVEFYLTGTNAGDRIVLRTRNFNAGCIGDLELERTVLAIRVIPPTGQQRITPPRVVDPVPSRFSDLAGVKPVRSRVFAFTEYVRKDEPEPDFYITEISNPKAVETPYMMNEPPAVIAREGTTEDWTLLNYTQEVHEFHIHQIHFLVLQGDGIAGGQSQLLDTVNIPFGYFPKGGGNATKMVPGEVRLRMDFRGPDIEGMFVYHCHILEHEDNGMMAKIRVIPPNADIKDYEAAAPAPLPDVPGARPGDHIDLSGLVDQNGHAFPSSPARGKVLLASFVATHCPEGDHVCPLTSAKFAALQKHIDPAREHLVQFSLDPKTDTPVALRAYGKQFGVDAKRWSLVTGSASKLLPLAAQLGEPRSGLLREQDALAIIGPDGKLRSVVHGDWQPSAVIAAARTPVVAQAHQQQRQHPATVGWLMFGPAFLLLPALAALRRRSAA